MRAGPLGIELPPVEERPQLSTIRARVKKGTANLLRIVRRNSAQEVPSSSLPSACPGGER